ncbi:MAG: hypothetical protein FJ299_06135 [Planctomycetes bacterium]|nr:hypothetical protein [Planctomycetota bacterium]
MRLVLVLVLLVLPASAADHFVGPGQPYAEIQPAIDAAQPGDRIFVAPGLYQPFDVAKALEIRGSGPGSTSVTGFFPGLYTKVLNVPSGAIATLAGMSFIHSDPTAQTINPLVHVGANAGTVVLQDLQINVVGLAYPLIGPGLRVSNSQRVFVQRCQIHGFIGSIFGGVGHPAIDAEQTALWISDSKLFAGNATGGPFTIGEVGAPALRFKQGQLHLARVIARGGTGEYGVLSQQPYPGGAGACIENASLVVTGGPTLVTGATNQLIGGKGTWNGNLNSSGGPGLELLGTSSAQLALDAVVQGGLDGLGVVPASPYTYSLTSTVTQLAHRLPSIVLAPQSAGLGTTVALEFAGNPGALVVPVVSAGLGAPLALPGVAGSVHIDLASSSALSAVTIGANSLGSKSVGVPADAALIGAHAWFQTGELAGSTLRLSNPARVGIAP